jgi:hypothetical protein
MELNYNTRKCAVNLEERIWMLDKNEASLLRSYFTNMATCHEEIDLIVAKKWNMIKKNNILTYSIIRRMVAYYRYSKEYSERKERSLGVEAGTYFEDIIFSPLKSLLKEKFGNRFGVLRGKKIRLNGIKSFVPDLVIEDTKTNNPVCMVEIKTWLDRTDWRNMKPRYNYCSDKGYLFICITGYVGGEELKKELSNVFWLTNEGFFNSKSEYEVTIVHPIESIFEKIISKCDSLSI